MDNYFRNFEHKILMQKSNRMILLASHRLHEQFNDLPKETIIKLFQTNEVPTEVIIHKLLNGIDKKILKIYDTWEQNGNFVMCMEYCSGGDLHQKLQAQNGSSYD